jgi:hypothetical protein
VSAREDGPRTRPGLVLSGHRDHAYARVRRQHGGSEGIWPVPHDRAGVQLAPWDRGGERPAFRAWAGGSGAGRACSQRPGPGRGGQRCGAGGRSGRVAVGARERGGSRCFAVEGWVAAGAVGCVATGAVGAWRRGRMIIAGPGAGQDGKAQIKGLAVTLDQGERGNNFGGEGVGPSP